MNPSNNTIDSGEDDPLLTYAQVAEDFHIPRGTLFYWVAQKAIPHIRLAPRTVRFRRSELRRWLDTRSVGANIQPQGTI